MMTLSTDRDFCADIARLLGMRADDTTANYIALQLTIRGRQHLKEFREDIHPSIYRSLIYRVNSELLSILKEYVAYQWSTCPWNWFQSFINDEKIRSSFISDQVLTIIADHGSVVNSLELTTVLLFSFHCHYPYPSLCHQILHGFITHGVIRALCVSTEGKNQQEQDRQFGKWRRRTTGESSNILSLSSIL